MQAKDFIEITGLRLMCERVAKRPDNLGNHNDSHWRCTLRCGDRRMIFYFSKGIGHNGAIPTVPEVLECMASDISSIDQDFENWCADYGLDSDSRQAERTYLACQEEAEKLQYLLQDHKNAYNALQSIEW